MSLLLSNALWAQIIGTTEYSFENAIVQSENNETTISVNDANQLTLKQGTASNPIGQNGAHGAIMSSGNTISMRVAKNASITFSLCRYSKAGATFSFTDASGNDVGSIRAESQTEGIDKDLATYVFPGESQLITATLNAEGSVYLHHITIENPLPTESLNGKIEVWDFGAEQLEESTYLNRLDVSAINAWYTYAEGEEPGASGRNVPASFTAGALSWSSTSSSSDRLRTSNIALTRYDANVSSETYTGRLYVNASAATSRYFSLNLDEDDEVKVIALSQNGKGELHFASVAQPKEQNDVAHLSGDAAEYHFVAKNAGVYRLYDSVDKPSYFRIYRKNATYKTLRGSVDVTNASGLPDNYAIVFINDAGKKWTTTPVNGAYSLDLPSAYHYQMTLTSANGYVISSEKTLKLVDNTTHDVVIEKVSLKTLSGKITGLGDALPALDLVFSPTDESKVYTPVLELDITSGNYVVALEPDVEYKVTAGAVNDYDINTSSVLITDDTSQDIAFTAKPNYAVSIDIQGLSSEEAEALELIFTNLEEDGYVYRFSDISSVALRNGVYAIDYAGLDAYPVEMQALSNLVVNGKSAGKTILFSPVNLWSFDEKAVSSDAYKGLVFTGAGTVSSELSKGHLTARNGDIIKVPMTVGQKMKVSYYYEADFSIGGGASITTTSQSTGLIETAEYTYSGTEAGYASIAIGASVATTYVTQIEVIGQVNYSPSITVGKGKDYETINEALAAIALMQRPNNERVNVMIEPGDYEEMLVIDMDNVSLTNAATSPGIALKDGGVNIENNAVRITSYYGHGYNYYSMGSNQKWSANALRVNKENGHLSYENKGSGTSNGSFWNATVVVFANGFEANHIIFENSFNQYISQKESEDIVVEWASGGKGERPVDAGNTNVQQKSFVERAAALAISGGDKIVLNNCRLVGRQDVLYGGIGSRVAVYKGVVMGGTDYIFGGMTAVFYKTVLAMNTSEDANDKSYITAGQQGAEDRGYLMYECTVSSAEPGVDNVSSYRSKPGSFGRCWSGINCEVLFYNTTVETSNNPDFAGHSLIIPEGWTDGLGGPSQRVGEYATKEISGVDNSARRQSEGSWGKTVLREASTRGDGVALTPFNFTKGADAWNPIAELVANDVEPESKTYYVATEGNDNNAGTSIAAPFVSITKALSKVKAGDVIYIREGTYNYSSKISLNAEGTVDNPIRMEAYQGEKVIVDFSQMTTGSSNRGFSLSGDYWVIKGLKIQHAGDNGMHVSGNYNRIEKCVFFKNRDSGLQLSNGAANNKIINCDSYANADPDDYADADGFACKIDVGDNNYFYGCRAWLNVDDGWDGYMKEDLKPTTTLENCWTWMNGYFPDGSDAGASANGNGFKVGGSDDRNLDHNFVLINCVAFDNKSKGFDQNNNTGNMRFINCTAYRNKGKNYSVPRALNTGNTAKLVNCIAIDDKISLGSFVEQTTNSWNGFSFDNSDFLSLDTTGVSSDRKADGSLPDLPVFRLAQGSNFINAGTDMGYPFDGSSPDLGAFRFDAAMNPVAEVKTRREKLKIKDNPIKDVLTLELTSETRETALIQVVAMTGKTLVSKNAELFGGAQSIAIEVTHLNDGIYVLTVKSPSTNAYEKFVKTGE